MRQRGFTLLEVLVATVIMGIAVVTLLSGVSGSMRNAARLTDHDRAALLARSKMDELLLDRHLPRNSVVEAPLPPELMGGARGGWRARLTWFDRGPHPTAGALGLERLELEVWWISGGDRRSFTLDGYRPAILQPQDVPGAPPTP